MDDEARRRHERRHSRQQRRGADWPATLQVRRCKEHRQVERPGHLVEEPEGVPMHDRGAAGQLCGLKCRTGACHAVGLHFERQQPTVGGQCPGDRDQGPGVGDANDQHTTGGARLQEVVE